MKKFILVTCIVLFTTNAIGQIAEICGDEIDNDGDGLTDCSDPECSVPNFVTNEGSWINVNEASVGDFNGDGFDDLVLAGGNSPNRIAINDGTGSFVVNPLNGLDFSGYFYTSYSSSVGDLDNDNDIDIWVAIVDGPDQVLINNGLGSFSLSTFVLPDEASYEVDLADLDADGDLDVLISTDQNIKVLKNTGSLEFVEDTVLPETYGDQAFDLTDFNGDGFIDVFVGAYDNSSPPVMFFNDGSGSFFQSSQVFPPSGSRAVSVVSGDIDGDLDVDIFYQCANEPFSRILLNDGLGSFSDSSQVISQFQQSILRGESEFLDFDSDGDLDLITVPSLVLYENDGSGNFSQNNDFPTYPYLGNRARLVVGDFESDGLDDFMVLRYPSQFVFRNLGGYFSEPIVFGVIDYRGGDLGDLDGDGDLDVIAVRSTSGSALSAQIFRNNGLADFQVDDLGLVSVNASKVKLNDFDKDGDLDAFVSNRFGPNQFFINVGNGDFSDSGQLFGDGDSRDFAAADFNGDGFEDVLIANSDQASRLLLNDGAGGFALDGQMIAATGGSYSVRAFDLEGDGDQDFALSASGSASGIEIYTNDGSGFFQGSLLTQDSCERFDIGDIDGDGDIDLVGNCSLGNDTFLKLFLNDGTGGFSVLLSYEIYSIGKLRLIDFDGDSDLDIVIYNGDFVYDFPSILINESPGNFVSIDSSNFSYGTLSASDVLVGDLDGDSDPDLVSLGFGYVDFLLNSTVCFNDLDLDGIPNDCDVDQANGADCDQNGEVDACQLDSDLDGIIDECDSDVDGDGIANECDLDLGGEDCNLNGIADNCDADLNSDEIPDDCQDPLFRRGDPNGDGAMDIGDGVTVLGYLFGSVSIDCFDAGDSNDDGNLNIADAITILSALFTGGDSPPEPGPASCDLDPTTDSLGCESYGNCS